MPYGELRFDDEEEENSDKEECEFCGRKDGHDSDCIYRAMFDDIGQSDE